MYVAEEEQRRITYNFFMVSHNMLQFLSYPYFLQGSSDDIKDYLPIELNKIKRASDKCLDLAKQVEDKFAGLMELTGRLLEASVVAKGQYEEQLKEAGKNSNMDYHA